MTDKTPKQTIKTSTDKKDKPTSTQARKPRHKSLWFAIFIVLLVGLIGVAGSAYNWHLAQKQQKQLQQRLNQLTMLQTNLTKQQANDQTRLSSLKQTAAKLSTQNQLSLKQLQDQISSISAQNKPNVQIQKNYQMLRALSAQLAINAASRQLMFNQNRSNALIELKLAKQNLVDMGYGSKAAYNVVDALILQVSQLPNIGNLMLNKSIQQLAHHLGKLSFIQPQTLPKLTAETPSKSMTDWKQALKKSWQQLKSLIVIRYNTPIGDTLINQSARLDATQLMQQALLQAQTSLMQRNSQSFQAALNKTINLVKRFTQASKQQTAWLKQAHELQAMPINYKLTSIKQNFAQLRSLIEALLLASKQPA